MKRQKSINDLTSQLHRFQGTNFFMQAYFAYQRAFKCRFGFAPHTAECSEFVKLNGKDCKR